MNQTALLELILPQSTEIISWTGLQGCADALALAQAIQNQKKLLVIITKDNHSAVRLAHELAFFLPQNLPILQFPDWEILPYDVFSPLPEIISQRLHTLSLLPSITSGAVIVSVATLMHRLAPRNSVLQHRFSIKVGDTFVLEKLRAQLEAVGYHSVSPVYAQGEFAMRGAVFDVFAMGSKQPFRLELRGDKIVGIKCFDGESQRSIDAVEQIELLPAREFPFTDESIKLFRQKFREQFPKSEAKSPVYSDVRQGIAPNGIEYYMPLLVEQTTTLFDYLPSSAVLVTDESFAPTAERFYNEVQSRFRQREQDLERPALFPAQLFLSTDELSQKLQAWARITIAQTQEAIPTKVLPDLSLNNSHEQPAHALQQFVTGFDGKILFVAETAGHREALIEQLRGFKISLKVLTSWQEFLKTPQSPCIVVAPLDRGLLLQQPAIALITETQLLGDKVQQRRRRRSGASAQLDAIVNNLNELTVGSPVVHVDHGVGRYLGLQTLTVGGLTAEFLSLSYANDDKLYVPVSALHLITRYTGMSADNAPLHKLGNETWTKAKKKALTRLHDVAVELLEIHAKRALQKGHAFIDGLDDYRVFASTFPFEETPDQQHAIDNILEDMRSDKPMDRVICGDVGFGKTEVAMRAAFIAVQNAKQVAVLVPTTLLAQQHYESFCNRFADWPVRIEVLSRFVSAKQQKLIHADITKGTVDIIIGTHTLLSKELNYHALGLVIIDEEHRFGVKQKEYFKKLRSELDFLTLTATPIPRTLNMAMAGLRDISIIATPPPNRHAIKTFISEWQDAQIKEACLREIKRGGQVFFLHNDVQTMDKMARELSELIPEAGIEKAHGQMSERELERVMLDFYHQRFNLLLCTTIVESGIDVPSANTIIINRADKLGLAQLHQLRGRVGRSHHRAYAYLIVPPKTLLTEDAKKRLTAIEASGDLGAGFMLSTHDMEIRGAGELLGDEQSGTIQEIGFTLYSELLDRTVNALKSGDTSDLLTSNNQGAEIDLQLEALIPEDYLPDIHTRLVLYKRLANTKTEQDCRELQIEMIDRFGLLPESTKTLFRITELKQQATRLGIKKIEAHSQGGRLLFTAQPNINTTVLIGLIQTEHKLYKLDGMDKLKFTKAFANSEEKLSFIRELLGRLAV
ncbi:MAG: transcription-repair coupling factor [Methylococcaceae bacterium]